MKNYLLTIGLLLVSAVAAAQLDFGPKGAITMSSLTTDFSEIKEAAKTSWQLGAFVRVGDKWHLQPEVYFTPKVGQIEYRYNAPPNSGNVTQDITFNNIDIPVLIGYKLIDPPAINVRLQAGPVASFVTGKKFTVSSDDGVDPPELSDEYKNSFKTLNWGMQFGVGVDFLFLTADLRYELGLSNLYDPQDGSGSELSEFKNNVFMLSVGWKIL